MCMKTCPRCGEFKDKQGTGICPTCHRSRHDKKGLKNGKASAAAKAARDSSASTGGKEK